jgi:hypothetical protein
VISEQIRRRDPWALGVAASAGAFVLGLAFAGWAGAARVWSTLLLDNFYFLTLALAAIVFIAIQYLTQAGWWVVVRRVPEAMVGFLPVAAGLTLLLFFGRKVLYAWSRPGAAANDALIAAKSSYLNTPFFFLRLVLFLGVWTGFAFALRRLSRAQEAESDGVASHRRLTKLSAAFIPVFSLTFALASFDWVMSLDPHWYSTIFGVYCFAGLFQGGIAAIALFVVLLRRRGALAGYVQESHLHDLGKLLFAFSIFWAYIWASQYLLIWYSDIPEEVTFYVDRTTGPWAIWFWGAFAFNFVIPFFVLMPRAAKRNPRILAAAAIVVLVGRWFDLYSLIGPPVLGRPSVGPMEILLTAGYAGLFTLVCLRLLSQAPAVAARDPYLGESLAHHV